MLDLDPSSNNIPKIIISLLNQLTKVLKDYLTTHFDQVQLTLRFVLHSCKP